MIPTSSNVINLNFAELLKKDTFIYSLIQKGCTANAAHPMNFILYFFKN